MLWIKITLCCTAGTLLAYFFIGMIEVIKEKMALKKYVTLRKREEELKKKIDDEEL